MSIPHVYQTGPKTTGSKLIKTDPKSFYRFDLKLSDFYCHDLEHKKSFYCFNEMHLFFFHVAECFISSYSSWYNKDFEINENPLSRKIKVFFYFRYVKKVTTLTAINKSGADHFSLKESM